MQREDGRRGLTLCLPQGKKGGTKGRNIVSVGTRYLTSGSPVLVLVTREEMKREVRLPSLSCFLLLMDVSYENDNTHYSLRNPPTMFLP